MKITLLYVARALRISKISYQRKAFASKWVRRFSMIISSRIEQFETRENGCCQEGKKKNTHCFKSTRKPVPENLRNRNGITFSYHTHELRAQEWLHFKQKAVFKAQMLGNIRRHRCILNTAVFVHTHSLPGCV